MCEELPCLAGEWYRSGTGVFMVSYRARVSRCVALVIPIHHRGDGEAAGE